GRQRTGDDGHDDSGAHRHRARHSGCLADRGQNWGFRRALDAATYVRILNHDRCCRSDRPNVSISYHKSAGHYVVPEHLHILRFCPGVDGGWDRVLRLASVETSVLVLLAEIPALARLLSGAK